MTWLCHLISPAAVVVLGADTRVEVGSGWAQLYRPGRWLGWGCVHLTKACIERIEWDGLIKVS